MSLTECVNPNKPIIVSDNVLTFKTSSVLHLFIVGGFRLRLYISFRCEHIYIYIYHTAGTMLRTQTYKLFSLLKPAVGQNITWQAPYTTKNYAFIVFAFMDRLASFSSSLP